MDWQLIAETKKRQIREQHGIEDCFTRFKVGAQYNINMAMYTRPNKESNLLIYHIEIGSIYLDIMKKNVYIGDEPFPSMNPFNRYYLDKPRVRELRGWYNHDAVFHEVQMGKCRHETFSNGEDCFAYETHLIRRVR